MKIDMNLADEPFAMMKSGAKTVEIRLYDEKRRKIKIGDTVVFHRLQNYRESIEARVTALCRYGRFYELFSSDLFPETGCGDITADEAAENMYKYYSVEQEKAFGVLGIKFELCN